MQIVPRPPLTSGANVVVPEGRASQDSLLSVASPRRRIRVVVRRVLTSRIVMRKFASFACIASALAAQNSVTLPKVFKEAYAPTANLLPVARTKAFIQTWYHGQNLPLGTVVTQMGWRYDQSGSAATGITHTMAVVLDNSPVNNAGFTNIYANNLSATPTTFLPMQAINWPAPPSGGLDPAMWIPGAVPFVFLGPHLIVQVDVQTETTPRTLAGFNTDAITMATTTPYLLGIGAPGCAPSSLSATAALSGTNVNFTFDLNGGPVNNQVVLLIAADNQAFGGSNVLPLDLGFIGMTGCKLGVDPITTLAVPTDGSGFAQLPAALPNIVGLTQALFVQGVHIGATPLGLVTTNTVAASVGHQGLMNYAYSWTNFGLTAEFGPYTTSRGAVILMR